MIIEVGISMGKMTGKVRYNTNLKTVEVDFPDKKIQKRVKKYLTTRRKYQIPESQRLDDYRKETALPTDSRMHFDLAMSSLWSNTEVIVNWETEREVED